MRMSIALATMVGLVSSFGVAANNSDAPDLEAIRAQQTELRAEVLAGKDIYGQMSKTEREQLAARQNELLQLIEGKDSFAELNERQQLEAFNTLEWINAAINDAEDQRLICTRESQVGSHRSVRVCQTVAERRETREKTQQNYGDAWFRSINGPRPDAGEILIAPMSGPSRSIGR